MGSWSVYCGISNISITAGHKFVFLPLKRESSHSHNLPFVPATLPIFGEYDDYGGIENIEKNDNTSLIEEHFNCTIEQFCYYFTRGCITTTEDDFPIFLKDNQELKDWTFMFIDRKVYDFMSTYIHKWERGNLDYGTTEILNLLGFKYNGEVNDKTYDPKRFRYEWEYDNCKLYSDGRSLCHDKRSFIYKFNGSDGSFESLGVKFPEDKKWISSRAKWQMYEYMSRKDIISELFWIMGIDSGSLFLEDELSKALKLAIEKISTNDDMIGKESMSKIIKNHKPKVDNIIRKYMSDLSTFAPKVSELVTIHHNLYCMSGYFAPYINYLTPQCGEINRHQILLEEFSKINKSYFDEDNDNDIDD